MSGGVAISRGQRLANTLGQPSAYLPLLFGVALLVVPFLGLPQFILHVFITVFITGTAAVAWNIIGGFGGQFSLGNAVFLGIGAYSTAILMIDYGQSALVGILVGVVLCVITAVVIGYPTLQLEGHYFALATIAIIEIMRYLARYFSDITGGSQGMSVYAMPGWANLMFTSKSVYYFICLGVFASAVLVSVLVRYSRVGYYLLAIREDEDAAAAIAVNTIRYKIYGFVLSAVLTGLAGGLYAVYIQFLSPTGVFSLNQSILYALIVLIGGLGTIAGPVIGSFLMVSLQTYVTTVLGGNVGALSYMAYGVLLILLIIYAPEGIVNELRFVSDRILKTAPEVKLYDNTQD